jgi:DNA-binding NarL/FixJ family response regulator
MTPNLITIIIADDHEFFRGGLITMLNKFEDIKVVAEASNGQQMVQLAEKYLPDVIIADIEMPGMNGIEATRIIAQKMPAIGIIALSMMDSPFLISEMMDAGANGYLLKDASKDEVVEGIRAVNKNKEYFCSGASQKIAAALGNHNSQPGNNIKNIRFTKREKDLIALICKGLTARQMSKILFLSTKTIENYRAKLLQKTGCKNMAEFTFFIARNNLFNPGLN